MVTPRSSSLLARDLLVPERDRTESAIERNLESPAGEINNSPAHNPPRPALEVVRNQRAQDQRAQDQRAQDQRAQDQPTQNLPTQNLPTLNLPTRNQPTRERRLDPLFAQLRVARDLLRRDHPGRAEPPLLTAEPALDDLLAGGLDRGTLVELVGGRSSGRFALVLTVLAAATGVGEAAVLIDLGDHLDPQMAAVAGVDLSRLLWLRPRRMKEALASAEMVLGAGFPLVVVDLGLPPVRGGRGVEAAWLRLARAARDHGAALLVSAPYRVSGTAAAAVLGARKERVLWRGRGASPRLLGELACQLRVEKIRGGSPGAESSVRLVPGVLAADFERPVAREDPVPRPSLRPLSPLVPEEGGRGADSVGARARPRLSRSSSSLAVAAGG